MSNNAENVIKAIRMIASGQIPKATPGDVRFAKNLIEGTYGLEKRGYLTEKQLQAGASMFLRLVKPDPEADAAPSLTKVYEFLKRARKHLKHPKLMLGMGDGRHLKVYLSGKRSAYPDTVNLVTEDKGGYMDLWLGRVFEDGRWHHRDVEPELHEQARQLLERLAEDPVAVAQESGHMTGNCCFCNRKLTDDKNGRSVDVGYGPVCAKKWNLPWGTSNKRSKK